VAGVAFVVATAGSTTACALFTDLSTRDYTLADASSDASNNAFAVLCEGGGCPTLAVACLSAADCDGGSCCLKAVGTTSAALSCETECPSPLALQLCAKDSECGSGVTCVTQSCSVNGLVVENIGACGTIPTCVAQ
jgi:hypothetical protein